MRVQISIGLSLIVALSGQTVFAAYSSLDFSVITPTSLGKPIFLPVCSQAASELPQYAAVHSLKEFNAWTPVCRAPGAETQRTLATQLDIDFESYTLLVADAGAKGSSGNALIFSSVVEEVLDITVYLVEVTAGEGPRLTQIVPSLRTFALIPRSSKSIRFVVSTAQGTAAHDLSTLRRQTVQVSPAGARMSLGELPQLRG